MRRIFLFLSFMVGLSISVNALPLHLTTHLRNVTPQDCERVIAKIAMTESKDPDLKNQLDEVPQCVQFFTERLTRESFRDKDYRKGCQDLLPDFCQQNRYLSLQTVVEKYKTNRLKLMGSMSLGFMYGRTAVKEVKRIADRFKKGDPSGVKKQTSKGEKMYEKNVAIKKECLERGPRDCKLTWKLKNPNCVDETKKSKEECECIPATWTNDYDPATGQCDKLKTECLANNGANKIPLRAGPNFPGYASGGNTNDVLNIMAWDYSTDKSRGINGCFIKQCKKGYMKDEYDLKCIPDDGTACKKNNDLSDTAKLLPPIPSSLTKAKLNAVAFDYRAGSAFGWGGCFISNCKPGFDTNSNKTNCVPAIVEHSDTPELAKCAAFDAPPNGFGRESIIGHIFGASVASPCRLICNEDFVAINANDPTKKKCESAAKNCTAVFTQGGKIGANILGWEYDATATDPKCQPLCQGATKLNQKATKETPVDELCINPNKAEDKKEDKSEERSGISKDIKTKLCKVGITKILKFAGYDKVEPVRKFNCPSACRYYYTSSGDPDPYGFQVIQKHLWDSLSIVEVFCQPDLPVRSHYRYYRLKEIVPIETDACSDLVEDWIEDTWDKNNYLESDDKDVEDVTELKRIGNGESFFHVFPILAEAKKDVDFDIAKKALKLMLTETGNMSLGKWIDVCE